MNGIGNVYLTSNVNMYEILLCKLYNSFINTSIHLNGPVPLHMYLFTFRTKNSPLGFFFYIFNNDMNTSI